MVNPNVATLPVLRFVERMREIEIMNPETEIRAPEVGERFNFIVANRYPWTYDARGRKIPLKVGDRYEYFDSLANKSYQRVRAMHLREPEEITIDLDYYIAGEIIGQFSRFLTYHPKYDKFYGPVESLENEEVYKAADEKAHEAAAKELETYYFSNFGKKYVNHGKKYQSVFRETNKIFHDKLANRYGTAAAVLNALDTLITGSEVTTISGQPTFIDRSFRITLNEAIDLSAKKIANKLAQHRMQEICKEYKLDPFTMYRRYVTTTNAICVKRTDFYKTALHNKKIALNKLLPNFEKVCALHTNLVQKVVLQAREEVDTLVDTQATKVDIQATLDMNRVMELIDEFDDEEDDEDNLIKRHKNMVIIQNVYNAYVEIAAIYRGIIENEMIKKDLNFLKGN